MPGAVSATPAIIDVPFAGSAILTFMFALCGFCCLLFNSVHDTIISYLNLIVNFTSISILGLTL